MKKINIIPELAERFDLPAEALGAIRVTLTGDNRLVVENHGGILEYSSERLVLSTGKQRLIVSGDGLCIAEMKGRTILARGKIQILELE